jgi:hypothetical protein
MEEDLKMMITPDRLKRYLAEIAKKYSDTWKHVDEFRSSRGKDLPEWPEWCFLPLAASVAIHEQGERPARGMRDNPGFTKDISTVGALATWRVTQGIYRFHPEIFNAVWGTPLDGDLPVELLFRLPEWCVYVETPSMTWFGDPHCLERWLVRHSRFRARPSGSVELILEEPYDAARRYKLRLS